MIEVCLSHLGDSSTMAGGLFFAHYCFLHSEIYIACSKISLNLPQFQPAWTFEPLGRYNLQGKFLFCASNLAVFTNQPVQRTQLGPPAGKEFSLLTLYSLLVNFGKIKKEKAVTREILREGRLYATNSGLSLFFF